MKCKACDTVLSDYESTRKNADGHFYDLCSGCFRYARDMVTENEKTVDIDSKLRYDTQGMGKLDLNDYKLDNEEY